MKGYTIIKISLVLKKCTGVFFYWQCAGFFLRAWCCNFVGNTLHGLEYICNVEQYIFYSSVSKLCMLMQSVQNDQKQRKVVLVAFCSGCAWLSSASYKENQNRLSTMFITVLITCVQKIIVYTFPSRVFIEYVIQAFQFVFCTVCCLLGSDSVIRY